jgi:hypothetical protein
MGRGASPQEEFFWEESATLPSAWSPKERRLMKAREERRELHFIRITRFLSFKAAQGRCWTFFLIEKLKKILRWVIREFDEL